jgi:hypothetical protein
MYDYGEDVMAAHYPAAMSALAESGPWKVFAFGRVVASNMLAPLSSHGARCTPVAVNELPP